MLKNENENEQDSGHEGETLKFEWHPVKAASNLKKHRVSFEEASSIFNDKMRVEVPDQWHSDDEQRYLGIGRSTKGRILSIYYTFRTERIRIISARLAIRWERDEYETGNDQGGS